MCPSRKRIEVPTPRDAPRSNQNAERHAPIHDERALERSDRRECLRVVDADRGEDTSDNPFICPVELLEVAANNPARRFYVELGYREVGTRPGYYRAGTEDAVMMERRIRVS